jgi:hypothetical protein
VAYFYSTKSEIALRVVKELRRFQMEVKNQHHVLGSDRCTYYLGGLVDSAVSMVKSVAMYELNLNCPAHN